MVDLVPELRDEDVDDPGVDVDHLQGLGVRQPLLLSPAF